MELSEAGKDKTDVMVHTDVCMRRGPVEQKKQRRENRGQLPHRLKRGRNLVSPGPYVIKLVARSLHRSTLIRRMAALSCKFLRLAGSLIIGGAPEGAGSATKNHENTQGRG